MSQLYTASFTELVKSRAAVFAKALNDVVNPTFKGVQNPALYIKEINALSALKRTPFPRQARLITAAAEHLAKNDSLIISAEMGTGKCILPDSMVSVNGGVMPIEQIHTLYAGVEYIDNDTPMASWFIPNTKLSVPSFDEQSGKVITKEVKSIYRQKVSEKVRKVHVQNGYAVSTTMAHKFLTPKGWTNKIEVGDYVAIPKREDFIGNTNNIINPELLAWMIGEGYMSHSKKGENGHQVSITQKDDAITAQIEQLIIDSGLKYRRKKDHNGLNVLSVRGVKFLYENGVNWGVSRFKNIPEFIMSSDVDTVISFLRAYFDAEGSITIRRKNGRQTIRAEYSTASKTIAYQIVSLLRKLGIRGLLSSAYKCATNGSGTKRLYYRVSIGGSSLRNFAMLINPSVEKKAKRLKECLDVKPNDNYGEIYGWDLITALKEETKLSRAKSDNLFANVRLSGQQKTLNIGAANKFVELCQKHGSAKSIELMAEMQKRIDSDIYFVKVTKIEECLYDGYVYDLEVEDTHNFVAENILVHNTQMGVSVAYLLHLVKDNKAQKAMIMCPTHLVSKWADEIQKVLGKGKEALIPYQIVIVKRWNDLAGYHLRALDNNKTYFFVLSKETAKLSYPRKACYIERKKIIRTNDEMTGEPVKAYSWQYSCPDCGFVHDESTRQLREPKIPRVCECGSVLRQVDKSKPSADRLSVAEYLKKVFPKGWIDLLLLDELHELKGGDTGQGNAFGMIASMAKKCVGLTGTLLNGYASSLFYILYRMNPKLMKEQLKLDYKDVERFVELYGAREETYEAKETDNEGKVTKKGKKIAVKELPRISPYLLTLLLPFTIFLRLDEMNIELPDYEEIVDLVEPDEEWLDAYQSYISDLAAEVRNDKRVLGALANDAISVCDLPFMDFAPNYGQAIYKAPVDESFVTAKEKKLVERVREELSEGRKCLLFATYTNLGVSKRLEELLSNEFPQFKIRALPSSVEASKREKWIKDNPCDVLISNPELVKTGLDLLEYPTIIFYQTTYNVFTLKQAARRSWRIGQTQNVKVIFMTYNKTAQRTALALISKKIAAANSLEGRLSLGNDLAGLEESATSMQVQLAKAIMNGAMGGEKIETSKWTFTPREWDEFEKAYIAAKDTVDTIMENVVETVATEDDFVETVVNELPTTQSVEEDDVAVETFADNKITIYRRVRRGKSFVEESVEATTAEIQAMVQADTSPIQLSLF